MLTAQSLPQTAMASADPGTAVGHWGRVTMAMAAAQAVDTPHPRR